MTVADKTVLVTGGQPAWWCMRWTGRTGPWPPDGDGAAGVYEFKPLKRHSRRRCRPGSTKESAHDQLPDRNA
jgi:hypothetical protein